MLSPLRMFSHRDWQEFLLLDAFQLNVSRGREGGGEIQEIEFRNCSSFPELFSSLFFVVSHTITPGFPVSVSATACCPSKAFPRKLQTFCPAGVGSVRTSCRCLLSSVRMAAELPGSDARNMVNVSSYTRTCGRVTPLTPARI